MKDVSNTSRMHTGFGAADSIAVPQHAGTKIGILFANPNIAVFKLSLLCQCVRCERPRAHIFILPSMLLKCAVLADRGAFNAYLHTHSTHTAQVNYVQFHSIESDKRQKLIECVCAQFSSRIAMRCGASDARNVCHSNTYTMHARCWIASTALLLT